MYKYINQQKRVLVQRVGGGGGFTYHFETTTASGCSRYTLQGPSGVDTEWCVLHSGSSHLYALQKVQSDSRR